jgi:signal transduction histidine kinase
MPFRALTEWSLQQRFSLYKAFAVSGALMVGVTLLWTVEFVDESQLFDQQLQQVASTLALVHQVNTSSQMQAPGQEQRPLDTDQSQESFLYQVWRADQVLQYRSPQAPNFQPLMRLGDYGFSRMELGGEIYRTYAVASADGAHVIQVAERLKDRERHSALVMLAYLASLLVPLLLVWRMTQTLLQRSIKVLTTLAARVDQRAPDDSSPMPLDQSPKEMEPFLESLNKHVRRTATVISTERQFTSLAAHELRSPMAGIRAHAQLAQNAHSLSEMQEELAQVIQGVDHAATVFEQLMDLSRIENLTMDARSPLEPIDLLEICQQVEHEIQAQAAKKGMCISMPSSPAQVPGIFYPMYLIVRNLIANAVQYSPVGGRVEVAVSHPPQGVLLTVDDSGPGIAPQDRSRAFERYNRLYEIDSEGMGLGLSIVARSVRLLQASIELHTSELGGLRVCVLFPI